MGLNDVRGECGFFAALRMTLKKQDSLECSKNSAKFASVALDFLLLSLLLSNQLVNTRDQLVNTTDRPVS